MRKLWFCTLLTTTSIIQKIEFIFNFDDSIHRNMLSNRVLQILNSVISFQKEPLHIPFDNFLILLSLVFFSFFKWMNTPGCKYFLFWSFYAPVVYVRWIVYIFVLHKILSIFARLFDVGVGSIYWIPDHCILSLYM